MELTISVSPDVETSYTVTIRQLLKWAESSVEGGPALIVKRKKKDPVHSGLGGRLLV